MDAFNRLQIRIMQDEMRERWQNCLRYIQSFFPRCQNRIDISSTEVSQESEGRVWVEVGNEGLRLRVTHLHPANPSIAEALRRKCNERRNSDNKQDEHGFNGKIIYPPEEDKISLTSLEDYWFNHWQGPYITADNNQNSYNIPKLRRSHRKSKRSNRCSICHKKIVTTELEENGEGQCFEREKNVLAHMPSVKLDARVLKEDYEDRSDDETSKTSISEDALSRCSASDEQLARMHRVLDNELRKSLTLFADETVSQDVTDAAVCMDINEEFSGSNGNSRFLNPSISPRQSRSCPCSPKLSTRTYSPESITNSPKSRSFVGISKFSLSSSLLAVHRQASNSFIPEFLKFDLGKSDSPSASKTNSTHNSLKSETPKFRQSIHSIKDDSSSSKFDSQIFPASEDYNESSSQLSKAPLHETQSLPTLKLSKMSLTYRAGVIISEENEGFSPESLEDISEQGASALPAVSQKSQSLILNQGYDEGVKSPSKKLLPDVVPELEFSSESNDASTLPLHFGPINGVINLGFDGLEESSDFNELGENCQGCSESCSSTSKENSEMQNRENCSLAHSLPSDRKAQWCLAPPSKGDDEEQTDSYMKKQKDAESESEIFFDRHFEQSSSSVSKNRVVTDPTMQVPNTSTDGYEVEHSSNTFIEKDVMQEARDMVFWWRQKNTLAEEESEFCLHETECKVKQKPLLMFLHGIGSSADVWNQQLWYFLSCGYEVVAPDLLGHGLSSAPRDKKYYSFSRMLDYVSLVFDLFVPQGRKCIVIGHNYGCALAVALARGRPTSVGLVVLASCGGPSPLAPYSKYESSLNSSLTRFLNPLISCGCLSREHLYTPRGKHFACVVSDDKEVSSTPRYVIEHTSLGQIWPEGDLAFHRRITIPTLLLHGMKDTSVSFVEMCEMEKTIPRAFLELIPGAGHELMTDSAEEVCHAIHRFIRRWKQHI